MREEVSHALCLSVAICSLYASFALLMVCSVSWVGICSQSNHGARWFPLRQPPNSDSCANRYPADSES